MRPRILLVHSRIRPHGGSNGVLVWTLQALRRDFDVTLLTWQPFDLAAMNRYFGTSLEPSDFRVSHVNPAIRRLIELDPDPGTVQPYSYLMRICKKMVNDFDLLFTTHNEADLGAPSMQYVHVPAFAHVYSKVIHSLDVSLTAKLSALGRGTVRPWMLLSNFSFDRMKQNVTIVNSDWTGRWFQHVYQVPTITVYPPAAGEFPNVPWEDREDGFVVIGRLNPNKRSHWCLRVLEIVRRSFPRITLHIIGSTSAFWDEASYYKKLILLIKTNAAWVTLHENVSREKLQQIVSRQRYGMHAMRDEHFGMAPAEMVLAGCIPFVHNSGGPPEIVGQDLRLIYDSAEDAAKKILYVLRSPAEQAHIRAGLALRKDLFRPEAFMAGILREVSRRLSGSPNLRRRESLA